MLSYFFVTAELNCCVQLCHLWTVMTRCDSINLTRCILLTLAKWRRKRSESLLFERLPVINFEDAKCLLDLCYLLSPCVNCLC